MAPLYNPTIGSISAGTTNAIGPQVTLSNANGVSFGANNGVITCSVTPGAAAGIGAAAAGTQTQTSGTLVFSNSNNITFGMSNSSVVTASYGGNMGLSAGTESVNTGTLVFSNSNGLTFGMSGSSRITASMDAFRVVSAGTTSTSGSIVDFDNAGNIRFGLDGATVTATAVQTVPAYDNMEWGLSGTAGLGGVQFTNSYRSLFVCPIHQEFYFPVDVTGSTILFDLSVSGSTATLSNSWTSDMFFGIYTLNGNTLSLHNSGSTRMALGAAATNNSTYIQSPRFLSIHSSNWSAEPQFFAGSRYWLGWFWSSSNALAQTASLLGHFKYNPAARSGFVGADSANNTTMGVWPHYGIYSATTAAFPTSIGSNQLNKQNAAAGFCPHMIVAGHTDYTRF